ncbi:GbsR/MarR family transcriptional regulator [Actinomadura rudentiformis]|uniref:GbsR/MarR family transcriptional regulator n=1 Tax=Actinomadura rudentiformis TaxID=359158 RepID=UPI0029905399|nr:helix-turn-helix domain-containing protein [Actinomadura rudentiformis]
MTHQDRRRIATGLADGLGYAEIARRLDRPTSTISREVTRNGGPDRYRADHAHLATERRARRATLARPPSGEPTDDADVQEFIERFAGLMIQAGLPRTAARVLVCLVATDAGALTAAELVQRLRVSPASISKAIAYLEPLELVQRERGRRGRERYLIDDDAWLRTWLSSARTHAMWADAARQGAELFGADSPAGARLTQMARFFADLSDDMTEYPDLAALNDAVTVFAALVHAKRPLTVEHLATALDWPADRVTKALDDAERHSGLADPVVLHRTESGAYTITAGPDRLSPAQRKALDAVESDTETSHA